MCVPGLPLSMCNASAAAGFPWVGGCPTETAVQVRACVCQVCLLLLSSVLLSCCAPPGAALKHGSCRRAQERALQRVVV